jgi:hypothetical protein
VGVGFLAAPERSRWVAWGRQAFDINLSKKIKGLQKAQQKMVEAAGIEPEIYRIKNPTKCGFVGVLACST